MKAYYEYEDGTFWAIRTEGYICLTAQGSKYYRYWPDFFLEPLTEKEERWWMLEHSKKTVFADSPAAEEEGQKLAVEKSAGAITQDAEFWRIAIEINAYLIYFVPDE